MYIETIITNRLEGKPWAQLKWKMKITLTENEVAFLKWEYITIVKEFTEWDLQHMPHWGRNIRNLKNASNWSIEKKLKSVSGK